MTPSVSIRHRLESRTGARKKSLLFFRAIFKFDSLRRISPACTVNFRSASFSVWKTFIPIICLASGGMGLAGECALFTAVMAGR
jgi:hypothetical protein